MFLLLIPESRKRPITESLLYKQINRFLVEKHLNKKIQVAFITITDGLIFRENSKTNTAGIEVEAPPKNFPSGRDWITKEVKRELARLMSRQLPELARDYRGIFVYARGSYLEIIKAASRKSKVMVTPVLDEYDFMPFKKKGIKWMKVGLRIPDLLRIFEGRLIEFVKKKDQRQPKLNL